jgi:hypothetical protein
MVFSSNFKPRNYKSLRKLNSTTTLNTANIFTFAAVIICEKKSKMEKRSVCSGISNFKGFQSQCLTRQKNNENI